MTHQQSFKIFKMGMAVVLLGLVGYVDFVTGFEVSVLPLYALPISFAAWNFGGWAGVASAIGCSGSWLWADKATGHIYLKAWYAYWNAGARLVFFLVVAIMVANLASATRRVRSKLEAFTGTLPLCTSCQKIGDRDGYWWDCSAYLHEYGDVVMQRTLCPVCARKNHAADRTRSAIPD